MRLLGSSRPGGGLKLIGSVSRQEGGLSNLLAIAGTSAVFVQELGSKEASCSVREDDGLDAG